METGEGFLRDSELPVMRSEQAESVKPCVLEGVSNVLSEAGSRVGRLTHNQHTRFESNVLSEAGSRVGRLTHNQQPVEGV